MCSLIAQICSFDYICNIKIVQTYNVFDHLIGLGKINFRNYGK